MSDLASKQPATPEELFASIAECPQQILLKKLLDLPPAQSGEVLKWFMKRFELAGEALMDFANQVHILFDRHLKKHDLIAQIMSTSQYTRAIRHPAKIS